MWPRQGNTWPISSPSTQALPLQSYWCNLPQMGNSVKNHNHLNWWFVFRRQNIYYSWADFVYKLFNKLWQYSVNIALPGTWLYIDEEINWRQHPRTILFLLKIVSKPTIPAQLSVMAEMFSFLIWYAFIAHLFIYSLIPPTCVEGLYSVPDTPPRAREVSKLTQTPILPLWSNGVMGAWGRHK